MMMWNKSALIAVLAVLVVCVASPADDRTDKKTIDDVTAKAVAFLKTRQAKDGTWSKSSNPGVTGIVLYGLLKGGKVKPDDDVAAKALKFVEGMIDTKEGHIAAVPEGTRGFQKNYLTTVNLLALQASGQEKYKSAIDKAVKYLKSLQWDEAQEKTKKDPFYGGVGYGPKIRPDMSNTHYFLESLKAGGVPAKDEVYKKTLVFVSRCQNVKGEHNDQPWADKIDDGSFIYVLGMGKGKGTKDKTPKDKAPKEGDKRPGYGSMTYVGLLALKDCGVPKSDVRFAKAFDWISKNYTVSENPGMPEGEGARGYYSYIAAMAKCLSALGVDEVTDAKGNKHDWRKELAAELAKKQQKDGSWSNTADRWMEGNPDLCTAYALIALGHCQAKMK